MSKVDQFESAFRAAVKAVYRLTTPEVARLLLVTDLATEPAERFAYTIEQFLAVLGDPECTTLTGDRYHNVAELIPPDSRDRNLQKLRTEAVAFFRTAVQDGYLIFRPQADQLRNGN